MTPLKREKKTILTTIWVIFQITLKLKHRVIEIEKNKYINCLLLLLFNLNIKPEFLLLPYDLIHICSWNVGGVHSYFRWLSSLNLVILISFSSLTFVPNFFSHGESFSYSKEQKIRRKKKTRMLTVMQYLK